MRSTAYPDMKVVYSLEPEDHQWTELVRICLEGLFACA